jgi:pyridoxal 5'-phosphate synthase pdxS subunit
MCAWRYDSVVTLLHWYKLVIMVACAAAMPTRATMCCWHRCITPTSSRPSARPTKGEAGTGDVVEAVRHARTVFGEIRRLKAMDENELFTAAKNLQAPYELVQQVAAAGRLPVVNFAAGGIATPADAALMMHLGVDGVFVGSGIFKSGDPARRARAIVEATTHYSEPEILAEISKGLGEAMVGISVGSLPQDKLMAGRGW